VPTGIIVARFYGNVDLTAQGSGRTGATNVLRTLGKRAAAVAFAGDFLKGFVAVLLVRLLWDSVWTELIAAIASVIGHSYSVFIGFKGGRGVVTGFGATNGRRAVADARCVRLRRSSGRLDALRSRSAAWVAR